MDDPRFILRALSTASFFKATAPPVNFKFLEEQLPDTSPGDHPRFVEKEMSDIVAKLADWHIDIGQTVGIKRLGIEIVLDYYEQPQLICMVVQEGWTQITPGAGSPYFDWLGPPNSQPVGGYASFNQSPFEESTAANDAGYPYFDSTQVLTHHPLTKIFTAKEFQLINLNFATQLEYNHDGTAVTPTSTLHDYTYETAILRENATGFSKDDIGKTAKQTSDGTFWELLALEEADPPVDPPPDDDTKNGRWKRITSIDEKMQILGSVMFHRPILFFKGGSSDGTHSQGDYRLYPSYSAPNLDRWNYRGPTRDPAIPEINAADERVQENDFGVNYGVYEGGYDEDGEPVGELLYTLWKEKANRWKLVLRTPSSVTKFPFIEMGLGGGGVDGLLGGGDVTKTRKIGGAWLNRFADIKSGPVIWEQNISGFQGMVVTGYTPMTGLPILTDTGGFGITHNTYRGLRFGPTHFDGSPFPHDPVTNPYVTFNDYRGKGYSIVGTLKLTFYPD